jgi:hypothetical protein
VPSKRKDTSYVRYITVTYRSVIILILLIAIATGVIANFVFPQATKALIRTGAEMIAKLGIGDENSHGVAKDVGQQQAHFTNIDGTVRVKKNNSSAWVNAVYDLPLAKGDVIQTGPEGIAKVVFADGTNYTIKQDSLIVVEDNSTNDAQQTQVAVQVTTGTVDLATATYSQGSSSRVIVAGATATFAPESAAQVRNDNSGDEHSILVKQGSGSVARNGEVVKLANYEQVAFKAESQRMTKAKLVAPPTLITPANMLPVFAGNDSGQIEFTWTPMDNTREYHIRIAKNPYFSQLVADQRIAAPKFSLSGVPEGAYYWAVQSVDAQGHQSVESDHNKFTIVSKEKRSGLMLALDPLVPHGHVIEVRGKTDPSARVIVNGEEVPVIGGDGGFRYYTPPLPAGENLITVTAQSLKGGMSTKSEKVVVQ